MAVAPILGAVAGLVGTGLQFLGAQKAASAQRRQERLRRQQLDLESARRRRQIIREAAINRARTLSQVGAQGVGFDSSPTAGATGGQSQASAGNLLSLGQSQELGNQMFDAKAQQSSGNSLAGVGGGISSLGGGFVKFANSF